jgi:uncharacterized protein (TIGR03083 family)
MTQVEKQQATTALTEAFESLLALAADLSADEWARPTALPGWDVKANVVHVLGTEAMLLGEPTPEVDVDVAALPHVRNDIGAFNEAWIVAMADTPTSEVLEGLRDRTDRRLAALRAMPQEEWDAETFTPAGPDSYGRFMRIRVMDTWMHEQDVREAVGRPGHDGGPAVELVLDELQGALGYVVGKKAGAPDGSRVTLVLTGPAGRTMHVAVDGRAAVVPTLDGPATTTITLPALAFTRLAGGRTTDASAATVEGDQDLGAAVLANLAFTI